MHHTANKSIKIACNATSYTLLPIKAHSKHSAYDYSTAKSTYLLKGLAITFRATIPSFKSLVL